jgi:hypothetical protein
LVVAALIVALIAWMATLPADADGPPGDGNCDGQVNSIDSALILQLSAGLLPQLPCQGNAEVSGDGQVNSIDSALILQFTAGLIDHLGPPGETPAITNTPMPAATATPTRTNTPAPGATATSTRTNTPPNPTSTPTPSGGTPVQYGPIYYTPTFHWSDTDIDLAVGQRIDVAATGSVIYDNLHLDGVSADGDGPPTGWGPCPDHSLLGYVGPSRPPADAPVSLANVICLGSEFSGNVPAGGNLYISINDRGGLDNNVGQWYVTVTVY